MTSDERQAAGNVTARAWGRRFSLLATLFMAVLLYCGGAGAQSATGNRNFRLINLTRFDIQSVSTSTPDSPVWTVLRGSEVDSGKSAGFVFDNVGTCVLQLRIDLPDGHYVAWTDGFDFCNVDTVTITYNGDNNTFTARAQ